MTMRLSYLLPVFLFVACAHEEGGSHDASVETEVTDPESRDEVEGEPETSIADTEADAEPDAEPDARPDLPGDVVSGLDERPLNATCHAFVRPSSNAGGDVALVPAFPNMDFDGDAIGLRRGRLAPEAPLRWFVLDRTGLIWTFVDALASKDGLAADGTTVVEKAEIFLDVPETVYGVGGEGGLLGFAFDPDFGIRAGAEFVYVHYTTWPANNVWRFLVQRGADGFEVVAQKRIFVTESGGGNHWGGDLAFGPDGYLYISLGDGGNGMTPADAQKATWLRGKILRIDPRAAGDDVPYVVPATNPFAGNPVCDNRDLADNTTPCPEIFARGFRNPWRMTFDRDTGRLWVGDVGSGKEEVNLVLAGENYGWNMCDGRNPVANCPPSNAESAFIAPIAQYRHYNSASVAGGFVYRGSALGSALQGAYIFTDVYNGELLVIDKPYEHVLFGPTLRVTNVYEHPDESDEASLPKFRKLAVAPLSFPVSWAEDENGELYVVTFGDGAGQAVFKLMPPTAPAPDPIPELLSQTGCVDPASPQQPAAGLVPYEINAPFWSDGAEKHRWLALPDGATIDIQADGDWALPVGAVVMKEFRLGGKRIETRFLVRHADGGWAGYTYRWRGDESDAERVGPEGELRAVGDQIWKYPSRPACMGCHTNEAGRSLGLETRQLNRQETFTSTGRTANQVDTFAHIGLFTTAPGLARDLPALVSPFGDAPLAERARAYLHANCAQCHRNGREPDLKVWTEFEATGLCENSRIIPGQPDASRLLMLMRLQDPLERMPRNAGTLIDTAGVELIAAWVASLTTCP